MAKKIEIGPYSAYAIAVKHGYTGTEEQWVNETNKNMTLAQAAATDAQASKEAAEASKNAATQSASESANSAAAAQASETAAASSENNAQASAEAAARSAEEAKSAASTDKTLTIEGSPADAKATGDALAGKAPTDHTHDLNAMINGQLSEETATPQDADYYISQYAGGGTETTTYHRRPLSSLWNWIKAKLGSAAFNNTGDFATAGHTHAYLPTAGGTMSGGITFANNTWNLVGDDAYIGDHNIGGAVCIVGANGGTKLALCNKNNQGDFAYIGYEGGNLLCNKTIGANSTSTCGFTISAQTSDPGAWSNLENGRVLLVYE